MSSDVIDFEWRKLRQLEGTIIDKHLIPYVMKTLPDSIMQFAIEDGLPDDLPEALDQEMLFHQFLLPWILFNWIPFEDFGLEKFEPTITLSENYLQHYKHKLSSDEKRFITAMNMTFYSYYAVLEVEKDKSLLIKDILLGSTHTVKERAGTHQLKRGDIVFSRILTLNNQSIFIGMAPFTMLPAQHHLLLDFKKWLTEENDDQPLNENALRSEFDLELVNYFFDAITEAYNRPMPTLMNTDGELMQFSVSHFKLTLSPEETLHHLISMTLSKDPEEFLSDAKRTKSGKITQIEFPWLKKGNKKHTSWDNTVHGHITLKEGKLILQTNSLERTERGKKLLTKLLGNTVSFQQTLIESPEQKMQSLPPSKKDQDEDQPNLFAIPEIQEHIKKMAKAHWDSWFDISIPVLNNQTPREAAKTQEGREQLEALLLQYEQVDHDKSNNDPFKADINFIKTSLSLEK